jgi:hypothetical protein
MKNSTWPADYIGCMCSELAKLAGTSRLHVLQYLLRMATLEASLPAPEDVSARNGGARHLNIEARRKVQRHQSAEALPRGRDSGWIGARI